jgi:superfamily I DNA/RNA helicase
MTTQTGPRKKYKLPTTWSPQQEAFISWAQDGRGSCVLEAVAGSGKTTTVLAAALKMKGTTAIVAFNKSIANEIVEKLEDLGVSWQQVKGGTVHSFGFAAYRKFRPGVRVDDKKVVTAVDAAALSSQFLKYHGSKVVRLVGLAKQAAIGVLGAIDDDSLWYDIIEHHDIMDTRERDGDQAPPCSEKDLIENARYFLLWSNHELDTIDFNDMIYLPLLLKLRFFQYDNVFIDEAQDTNPARRALARAILKKGGRLIAVGDRHQAIYGFTGADNDSLEQIKRDFNAIEMPLTVTYRCPKAVVSFARQWVDHIEAHDTAPEGQVTSMDQAYFDSLPASELTADTAILCRLNKPLVRTAFALIRRKVACKVEGRDIGQGLKKLATRWKVTTLENLEDRLEKYLDAETTKLLAKKQEAKLAQVEDQVETLRVIMDQCRSEQKYGMVDLLDWIDSLFADDVRGVLTLSSIHKSKGREWERVLWLNRESTCPSPWARQQWQMDQEVNLMYVAATRAKSVLVDLSIPEPKKQ